MWLIVAAVVAGVWLTTQLFLHLNLGKRMRSGVLRSVSVRLSYAQVLRLAQGGSFWRQRRIKSDRRP